MKNFARFLHHRNKFIFSILLLVILACGPMADWSQYLSYFQPETAKLVAKGDESYFFEDGSFYGADDVSDSVEIVQEWKQYFNGRFSEVRIAKFLYGKNKFSDVDILSTNKSLGKYFSTIKKYDLIYEIYFDSERKDSLKKSLNSTLIKSYFDSEKSVFLKERFGLQYMRILASEDKNKEVISFYNTNLKPIIQSKTISLRAKSRAAGSKIFAGNKQEAFYDFAQIFDQNPSMRHSADLSVRSQGIKFTEEALQFCKTDHEKVAVYTLAAIQPYQDAMAFIPKIYALEPNFTMLEFLTAREINRNEYYYNNPRDPRFKWFGERKQMTQSNEVSKAYFEKLALFTEEISKNTAIQNPSFWSTAAAYCAYVNKNCSKSRSLLAVAKNQNPNEILQNQQLLQEVLLLTKENAELTPDLEAQLLPMVLKLNERKNFRQTQTLVDVCKLLSKWYRPVSYVMVNKSGWLSACSKKEEKTVSQTKLGIPFAKAKSLLFALMTTSNYGQNNETSDNNNYYEAEEYINNIADTTSSASVKELIEYAQTNHASAYDQAFVKLINRYFLSALYAKKLLEEHKYSEAAIAFSAVKPKDTDQFNDPIQLSNPFWIGIPSGELSNEKTKFVEAKFASKMDELSKKQDAESYYFMGCGAFNISFWGKNWYWLRETRYSESEIAAGDNYYRNPLASLNADYYQLKTATKYFETALKKTEDRELKAKIYYGLALIERAKYDFEFAQTGPEYDDNFDWEEFSKMEDEHADKMQNRRTEFQKNFEILKSKYMDTKYNQLLLQECSTYEHFASKSSK